jgi:hypothetical protein
MFDALVDDFRNHSTEWLESRRRELIGEQRRLHSEELAIVRVLDERGRIDARLGDHGESPQTVRQKLETARRLESLPNIGAAACEGQLSDEQLDQVVQLADEDSDAYWAERAPHAAPMELSRMARNAEKPSTEDSLARQEARSLTMRWNRTKTMLQLHGLLPDVMGAQFEKTINDLLEAQRPRKGEAWDTFQHRAADALVRSVSPVAMATMATMATRTRRRWRRGPSRSSTSRSPVRRSSRACPSPTPCSSSGEPT